MFKTYELRLKPNQMQCAAFEDILRDSAETYNAVAAAPHWNKGISPSEDQRVKLIASAPKRAIVDISTGERFESIREASRKLGIYREGIQGVVNGRNKTVSGKAFRYA